MPSRELHISIHRSEDVPGAPVHDDVNQRLARANPHTKGMNASMDFSTVSRRRLTQVAAVGAVTLVLAGATAHPADAMRRRDAVSGANMAVGGCFNGGGSPDSYEYGGTIYVSCTYDDGSVVTVHFPYGN